jgi:hypothetical protein
MTKTKTPKPKYIEMLFEEALQLKYENGKKEHRKTAGTRFDSEHGLGEELFCELIDAYSYVVELEKDGVELPGYRTTLKNMALNLQSRERELRRRI